MALGKKVDLPHLTDLSSSFKSLSPFEFHDLEIEYPPALRILFTYEALVSMEQLELSSKSTHGQILEWARKCATDERPRYSWMRAVGERVLVGELEFHISVTRAPQRLEPFSFLSKGKPRESYDVTIESIEKRDSMDVEVEIYLADPSDEDIATAESAVRSLAMATHLKLAKEGKPIRGSWRKYFGLRTSSAANTDDLRGIVSKVKQALELEFLEKRQADADQPRLEGTAELLTAIGDKEAVVRIGSILLVQRHSEDGSPKIIIHSLTHEEIAFLRKNSNLLSEPNSILDALATIGSEVPGAKPTVIDSASSVG